MEVLGRQYQTFLIRIGTCVRRTWLWQTAIQIGRLT